MDKITLSAEELIFCFYDRGLYNEAIELKNSYFPDINDEQMSLILQVACRGLLAKDMVIQKGSHYKLKDEFTHFVDGIGSSPFIIKASQFTGESQNQESINLYFKNEIYYMHKLDFEKQVHQINAILDSTHVESILSDAFAIKEENTQDAESIFTCNGEQFEILLTGVTEQEVAIGNFIELTQPRLDKVGQFVTDLKLRQGKMDSIMVLNAQDSAVPQVEKLAFIIPGSLNTWIITGVEKNEFKLYIATKEILRKIINKQTKILV